MSFKPTASEIGTITGIARRAAQMTGRKQDTLTFMLDIELAHKFTPLRLRELLEADDANFAHDVFGINQHLNRDTGKFERCFLPRFAA